MNPLFNNEKHYLTLNNYLKNKYHKKVFKISLNGNFSCPNRDGKISRTGCLFCSSLGSGDFAGKKEDSIPLQFKKIKENYKSKWPEGYYIPYFQANTNTYGTVDELKKRYEEIIHDDFLLDKDIVALSIATRPDCLDEEILKYLKTIADKLPLWVELGFQTANELTAKLMNRGYNNDCLIKAVTDLKKIGATVIVHIINGLPNETKTDMINTVKFLNNLPIDGIKIHMLHVIKDSVLGQNYLKESFPLLTLEEYVDIVTTQLRYLNENIVIHRLTGDAVKENLIEPKWTLKKFVVTNEIDKRMRKENIYQGDLCIK